MRLEQQSPDSTTATAPSLRSGSTKIVASQIVRRGARMVALLAAARVLGPSQFGLYTVLLTITEIVAIFSGAGYADFLTREVAREGGASRRLVFRLAVLRVGYLGAGVACATAVLFAFRFSPVATTGAALMGVALFPRSVNELAQGVIRGRQLFARLVVLELLQGLALVIGVLIFLVRGKGIQGLIAVEILSATVGALAALLLSAQLYTSRHHAPSWGNLFRSTFAFNLYPLIVNVYDRADVLLLSRLASNAAVGIYGLPYRVFSTLQIIPYGLMSALLPQLSGSKWSGSSDPLVARVLRRSFALALVFILAAMMLATPAIRLLLGGRYEGAGVALKILIWAVPLVFINSIYNTVLLAINRERVFLLTATVCTVVNVVANILVIPTYSYRGAASVTVFTEFALFAQNLFFIRKALGHIPAPPAFGALSLGFAVACVAGIALQHFASPWIVGIAITSAFSLVLLKRGELPALVVRKAIPTANGDPS